MTRLKIKKLAVPAICLFLIGLIFYSTYKIWELLEINNPVEEPKVKTNYVNKIEDEYIIPAVTGNKEIIKPFTEETVEISIPYYKIDGTSEEQQNALIYYENIYMQNTGIMYSSPKEFEVFSVLDGKVTNIKEDAIMGKIVEIEHSNKYTTVYQSLNEVKVTKGQNITQGEIIGTAGFNPIIKDNKYSLHFEVFKEGEIINPQDFYNLSIEEINE